MSLKSILVHLTHTEQSRLRLETALALCLAHDAHLTGLGVRAIPQLPVYSVGPVPDVILEPFERQQTAALAKARATFEAVVKREGWTDRSDWIEAEGNATDLVGLHARYTDLSVTGQDMPEEEQFEISTIDLVMRSGRPVLVTPHGMQNRPVGKRVLVAWNDSRESARAVADAMPILEAADTVDVLSVGKRADNETPGADIAQHLARHGVDVNLRHAPETDTPVGEVLLNDIADHGIDLLVMGAYGHSRFREMVFGGVTRRILDSMTVPVLMSH